jgi:hypothetical protein
VDQTQTSYQQNTQFKVKIMKKWTAYIGILVLAGTMSSGHGAIITVDPAVDDLKLTVESADAEDALELLKGVHTVDEEIIIPSDITIMADPTAPHGSVVVQGGNNSTKLTLFRSSGSEITISSIRFEPDPDASLGGRAVWVPNGGGNLTFSDNIVNQFTDAVFAFGQTSGTLEFRNNDVTIVDRDPDANNGFLGGNAGLTVLFAELSNLNASGNTIQGPGRNVNRFIAVSGIIVFNISQTIGSINLWNNNIKGFDIGLFTSGKVSTEGATLAENSLHNNGAGVVVGQVPPPDITDPTPAENTMIEKNRITGNDIGVLIDENSNDTLISRNQIAGNRAAQIIDNAPDGETTIGENLIRGKNTDNPPSLPPGRAFDPVTAP